MHFQRTLFIFLVCITSCTLTTTVPEPSNDIVYEVFVQSFCDSNGDGIGDLPGLISKLDYIRDLGATAIWMMPVHPSPSYHKYDVSDYYAIHPDYGTMEDMDRLIAETHARKMKLILDVVVNHTSSDHPWFIASSSSPDDPRRPFYVWKNVETIQDEIQKKTTTFDSDNLTQWHPREKQDEHYYGFFWKGMPDLNFDHPPVREEIYKMCTFWIEKGIDGFRLDAAKHIYPDDRLEDTRLFWEEFTARMKSIKPDMLIVGEVWADPPTLSTLFKGLPSLFNFELTRTIPDCILQQDANRFISSYTAMQKAYQSSPHPFEDAILLCNHDMNRIRSTLEEDLSRTKVATSILLTLPGTPYIYYGDEIGMLGVKPDVHLREPFIWGQQTYEDTTWQKPVYSIPSKVNSLEEQKQDPASLYHHYKRWIALRKENPLLARAQVEFLNPGNNAVLAYTLTSGDTQYHIFHNLSAEKIQIPFPFQAKCLEPVDADIRSQHVYLEGHRSYIFLAE